MIVDPLIIISIFVTQSLLLICFLLQGLINKSQNKINKSQMEINKSLGSILFNNEKN